MRKRISLLSALIALTLAFIACGGSGKKDKDIAVTGIDKNMNQSDLRDATGLSTSVIAKLGKGQSVTTDVLLKICKVLDCDFADIMSVDNSCKEDGK